MNRSEYASLDGLGLAELIAKKEVSVREVAQAALAAIEAIDSEINAVIERYEENLVSPDERGLGTGPFRGVPFLVKDVGEHFGGRRMENGSRLCKGMVVAEDDYFAKLVKASGVSLVGRSNTPEYSMALCADNLLYGATSNPWRKGYSTSGSSGGGAAAVAAGIVPIAHGSDMGGSIRGPASWCGTVGLLPSRGRISAGPREDEWGFGLAQSFVLTRTMRDTAAMLDCLGVPQPGDPFVVPRPEKSYREHLRPQGKPIRIGYSTKPLTDSPVDPEVAAAVIRTAKTLSSLGYEVEEAAPDIDNELVERGCLNIWFFDFHRYLDDLARRTGREVGPDTVERATLMFYEFAREQPCSRFFEAQADFNRVRRRMGRFFATHDVWLSPTTAQVAQRNGIYGMNINLPPAAFIAHENRPCQYLIPYNVAGCPALSLPLAMHSSGLPVGVQLGARPAEEHLLIELGSVLEDAMPWRDRRPPLHVSRPQMGATPANAS